MKKKASARKEPIRILVADDHVMVRQGVCGLLQDFEDFDLVGEAGDGWDALRQAHEKHPDVVIMDVNMPGLNGIDATRRFADELPDTKVIAVTVHDDRQVISDMLEAGAKGYLLKQCAMSELADAVRAVMNHETYLSRNMVGVMVDAYVVLKHTDGSAQDGPLTQREREVLQLLAEGQSTKEIARMLSVSGKTVETHRRRIMDKLGLHSVAELTKHAIKMGLTSLDF